jgi:PhnB protein
MKPPLVQAYLFFSGQCEEAVRFYCVALGAEPLLQMRFKESPDAPPPGVVPPGWDDKILHASFRVGDTVVMASDGGAPGTAFGGFSLSVAFATEAEAQRAFAALAAGGRVAMPLTRTFWSPCFGMLTDRYGVGWMITLHAPAA